MRAPQEQGGIPAQKDFEIIEIPWLKDRFNVAAWLTTDGSTMLLAREVKKAAEEGEPDIGRLVQLKSNTILVEILLKNYVPMAERVVWDPEGKNVLLEDPRALPDGAGMIIGLTALVQKVPYPAVTRLESRDRFEEINDRQVGIIRDFGPGKNTTPLDDGTFLFRKEGDENNHLLTRFSIDENSGKGRELENIVFPSGLEWASWRIGTTMPPIPIGGNEYLMVFHGIKQIKQEDGKVMSVYSLGRIKLEKNAEGELMLGEVDPIPILTRGDLSFIKEELHPNERRVVYACGGMIEGGSETSPKILNLFVNVGDLKTVIVQFPFDTLLDFSKPLRQHEQPAA